MDKATLPERFYLLDILRGFASLSVVLFHYKIFFRVGGYNVDWKMVAKDLPFIDTMSFFYFRGELAVYLFFVLSGFVFFLLYLRTIQQQAISAKRFAILRFSRLYPLHIVTLLLVAIGQAILIQIDGRPFNFGNNDLKHFVLNIFMISEWGLNDGYSFNGPFWSVSIEVLMYLIFFSCAPYLTSALRVLALVFVGVCYTLFLDPLIGKGIMCFFMGGSAYLAFRALAQRTALIRPAIAALTVILIGQCYVFIFASRLSIPGSLAALLLFLGIFPSLILLLALFQLLYHEAGRHMRIIGDITYATYLTHFPLQLVVALLLRTTGMQIDFSHWATLIAYIAAVILVSIPTYYYFELPARRYLRHRLLR